MERSLVLCTALCAGCFVSHQLEPEARAPAIDPDEGFTCTARRRDLDVLFVINDSSRIGEEQRALAEELPALVRMLRTGDLDEDGREDFSSPASIHFGVVSTDMGAGDATVPSCEPGLGDDGVLQEESVGERCVSHSPLVLDVVHHPRELPCAVQLGTAGCDFEQPLEAMLKALSSSGDGSRFQADTTGHADGANSGFLRSAAVLAIVMLTDEDDCSLLDPALLDPASSTYAGDVLRRCHDYPQAVQPIDRYVEGLIALKASPRDVVFTAITGVPIDLQYHASIEDYDRMLADERMQDVFEDDFPPELVHSCFDPRMGIGYPPRRIVETARELERRGALTEMRSICQDSYAASITAIVRKIGETLDAQCR